MTVRPSQLYGVGSDGQIWTCMEPCDGTNWSKVSNFATNNIPVDVASGNDYVYAVDRAGKVSRCKKPCTIADWTQISGFLTRIAA